MRTLFLSISLMLFSTNIAFAEVFLPNLFSIDTVTLATSQPIRPPIKIGELHPGAIEAIMGMKGRYTSKDKTLKIEVPRKDLDINVNGVKLTAAMGLTSWATFKMVSENDVLMKANLVMTENQVNQVMRAALDNNLSVTALHNHLLWESPKVMFMHVEGKGDPKKNGYCH